MDAGICSKGITKLCLVVLILCFGATNGINLIIDNIVFSGDKKVQLALFTLKAEGIVHLTIVNDGKQSVSL